MRSTAPMMRVCNHSLAWPLMPYSAARPCPVPGCPELIDRGTTRCPTHQRPTANQRGYGAKWQRSRPRHLAGRACIDCGGPAQVRDHWPHARDELVRMGVADPDAAEHTVPRCIPCHNARGHLHNR